MASLMDLGSAAEDVGSHRQEAQEARVHGVSSAAGAGGDGEGSATEPEGDFPEADRRSLPAMMMPAELKTEVCAADAFVTPPMRPADADHTSAVKRAMERALPKGKGRKGLDISDIVALFRDSAAAHQRQQLVSEMYATTVVGPGRVPEIPEQLLKDRPLRIGMTHHTCALFGETDRTRRRCPCNSGNKQVDVWRNSGGKRAVVCQRVPKHLLLEEEREHGMVVSQRHGKITRVGYDTELRYIQYNMSPEARPSARAGIITIYQVLDALPGSTKAALKPRKRRKRRRVGGDSKHSPQVQEILAYKEAQAQKQRVPSGRLVPVMDLGALQFLRGARAEQPSACF